jgi:hypothetical protein
MRKKVDIMKEEITHLRSSSRAHMHHSSRKSYAYDDSKSSLEVYDIRHQGIRYEMDGLQGDLRNINPPSSDGEREREYDYESYFLEIWKYI